VSTDFDVKRVSANHTANSPSCGERNIFTKRQVKKGPGR